jgi:hypothetical protein
MTYIILTSADLSNVDYSQVLETSENTVRYSLDGSKFLLKFEGNTPTFLEGKETFNYSEIMNILNSSEWAIED